MKITEFPPQIVQLLRLYGTSGSYEGLYRHQPNVRFVIDFQAKEVADLKLKVYEKLPTPEDQPSARLELEDSDLQDVLNRPSGPSSSTTANRSTRFTFWYGIVSDIGIFDLAYARKIRRGASVEALTRIPYSALVPFREPVSGMIEYYKTSLGEEIDPNDILTFHGYDPSMVFGNTPPLETLRQMLAEEWAMGQYREWLWRNGAKRDGIILRPLEAEPMGAEALDSFLEDFAAAHSGLDKSGKPAFLDEGMDWKESVFDARQAEYIQSRKLNRSECAAAYGIPASLVGATDRTPTKEERTMYYVDQLQPLLTRLEEEVNVQLLPEFEVSDERVRARYVQFNLDQKLRGSFEEQAAIGSTAVGRPYVLMNEWRARMNLPPVEGGDEIVTPQNVLIGNQASPQSPLETPATAAGNLEPAGTTPNPERVAGNGSKAITPERLEFFREGRTKYVARTLDVLTRTFERQRNTVLGGKGFARKRWDNELATDLHGVSLQTASYFGRDAAKQLGGEYDETRTVNYLKTVAQGVAENINAATEQALTAEDAEPDEVFDLLISDRAPQIAETRTTFAANWGIAEAARQVNR